MFDYVLFKKKDIWWLYFKNKIDYKFEGNIFV